MSTFTYYTPTKLYIDEDINNVGKIIKEYNYKKILLLYGQQSIKKIGLYDKIVKSLKENEIEFVEASGVEPNPKVEFVREILSKNDDFEMILAVGGGSVIDTAKSIGVSYRTNIDPWDFNSHLVVPTKSIPVGVVLTISAAGSEMSNSCVLSNLKTYDKRGFNSDLIRPLFAIMNPELTYTVSKYQTACGIVDILMHTLERFISDYDFELSDEFAIGVIKNVIKYGKTAVDEPNNYLARKNIMLASSFSHNGLTNVGSKYYFRAHQFEHVISGYYDNVSHGAGLSVVWPAYARAVYRDERVLPKFLRLAYEVFDVEPTVRPLRDAHLGIVLLECFFQEIGMPVKMGELGIPIEEVERFALKLTNNKTRCIPDFEPIDYERAKKIFELMW